MTDRLRVASTLARRLARVSGLPGVVSFDDVLPTRRGGRMVRRIRGER